MPLRKLASSHSHAILAKLIDLGLVPPGSPITVSAKCEESKLQVVITIAQYEPVIISPDTLAKIEAMKAEGPRLTPQMRKIAEILEGQPPRKGVWVAAKLGKKNCDGGLREVLSEMVKSGILVKGPEFGYMLPTK
jgi:hypothetical protein